MPSITIVGTGRMGSALALALDRASYQLDALIYRSTQAGSEIIERLSQTPELQNVSSGKEIDSDLLLITTQDTEIESVANKLGPVAVNTAVLHTSGSLSSDVLQNFKLQGNHTASMHPLVSISDPITGSEKFAGSYFCIEGDEIAVEAAAKLAHDLGGRTFSIPTSSKPLYHAAAVMASGHLTALIDTAISVFERCGVDREQAALILAPLITSTIDNLSSRPPEQALTGTFARLDRPAFFRHLHSLEAETDENTIDIYLDLALRSLEIVSRGNADAALLRRLRDEVSVAKRNRHSVK
jgi:predicted short-subunit dehydrogenase-like oxidoreductase (DUF2520 family)